MAKSAKRSGVSITNLRSNKKPKQHPDDSILPSAAEEETEMMSDLNEDEDMEIVQIDFVKIQENVKHTGYSYTQNKKEKDKIQREVELRQQTILQSIKTHQDGYDDTQQAFERAIWPIIAANLPAPSADASEDSNTRSVALSRLLCDEPKLAKDWEEVLVKSDQLLELWTQYSQKPLLQSKVVELQNNLREDLSTVRHSIGEAARLTETQVCRAYATGVSPTGNLEDIGERQQKYGHLLFDHGQIISGTKSVQSQPVPWGKLVKRLSSTIGMLEKFSNA